MRTAVYTSEWPDDRFQSSYTVFWQWMCDNRPAASVFFLRRLSSQIVAARLLLRVGCIFLFFFFCLSFFYPEKLVIASLCSNPGLFCGSVGLFTLHSQSHGSSSQALVAF